MAHGLKWFYRFCILLITLLAACTSQAPSTADVMYFILIDRFVDGDSTNNSGSNPESYLPYDGTNPEALKHYQGGDLVGITQRLDSLQTLGITILWLSPFLDNSNTDYVGWWPYHGYHPIDYYAVDEHFGTLADLQELVRQAHLRGLKIIFDMPFNQTAADHPWVTDPEKWDWYHHDDQGQPFDITDWQNQTQIEQGELQGLPDLAQENPEVRDYLIDVSRYWIETTGCDGFRLDAVKHIPKAFWHEYNAAIKALAGPGFLLLGEVFWGDAARIAPYTTLGFDLLFDIPGYYAIRNTFNKGGSIRDLSEFYHRTDTLLGPDLRATLIDNHDVARFNVGLGADAWSKQLLALGWLLTTPGLPVIYYGTELGMPGFPPVNADGIPQDFLNRLPYPRRLDSIDSQHQDAFKALVALRQNQPALAQGDFKELYQDWSIYAYLRTWKRENDLVLLNNASSQEFLSIPLSPELQLIRTEQLYGAGVLRLEGDTLLLRLPAYSLSVWKLIGEIPHDLSKRVAFTDRLSRDYQMIPLFYLDPDTSIEQFEVAGDFNNWQPQAYASHRSGDSLLVTLPLKPGSYTYKLVLNGSTWIADPQAAHFSLDPYGGQNSILEVSASP